MFWYREREWCVVPTMKTTPVNYDNDDQTIKNDKDWFNERLVSISPELKVIAVIGDDELHHDYFVLGKESEKFEEELKKTLLKTDRYSIVSYNYKFPVKFDQDDDPAYEVEESTLAIRREAYPLGAKPIRKRFSISSIALWVLVVALIVYKFMEGEQ